MSTFEREGPGVFMKGTIGVPWRPEGSKGFRPWVWLERPPAQDEDGLLSRDELLEMLGCV